MSVSILVVDDEPDVAELFRQRFRREARQGTYVMHFATSGEDALAKLDNGIRPELIVILSDINMPGMDGLALLRAIKERWAELPVMMVRRMAMTSAAGAPVSTAPPSSSPSRSILRC
jgi:CheY-like chemotaxis protein